MEITNIFQLDRDSYKSQDYKPQDETLLNELIINKEFGNPEDKIEVHVISPDGEVLNSSYDFRNYTVIDTVDNSSLYNEISLNPKTDLESFGYFNGQYDVNYNFLRNLFLSSFTQRFFIKEISSDRTELRISSNDISYEDLGQSYLDFITIRNSRNFYSDFLLNFSDNELLIAVNVAFDNVNTNLPSLYIKLYEPLPSSYNLNSTLWLVEQISEPYSFRVNTEFIAEEISTDIPLRGPNINVELNEQVSLTTPYLNLSNLLNTNTTSSFQQLQSLLEEKSIDINIDYSDFSNFIHFSSAQERLENFKYKLNQIQILENDINNLSNITSTTIVGGNIIKIQEKINNIIKNFDGYEYYLYFESGSNSWPKSNSSKPYINQPINSIESLTWFGSINFTSQYYGGKILEAENYDINNSNYIWNNLPEYIKVDSQNSNLKLFVSMLGQHYDYIWTYIKDITNLHTADNRLDYGISKDLVADALKNFGIKLYTNSRNNEDIYTSLLGITPEGTTLPLTGSYLIDTYITASQETIPSNDIIKETYKRIYHNLPYLLKTKGTKTGLRALINCFGIPETILRVNEFSGIDERISINNLYEKFNYNLINSNLEIPFYPSYQQFLNTGLDNIYPDTLEFRFKLDSNNILSTQPILESSNGYKIIEINHAGSINGNIKFGLSNGVDYIYSPSIELPLYNNNWWTLNLTREFNNIYTLYIGSKDDNEINYLQSCSLDLTDPIQSQYNIIGWNTEDILIPFSGSIQEFRYWIGSILIDDFKDHILNPLSISYNNVTSSYSNLIFRLPLGSELDNTNQTTLTSVHPSNIASFYLNNITLSDALITEGPQYVENFEKYLINSPSVGSFTESNKKIRITDSDNLIGNVLTPFISIQKPNNEVTINDTNIVEVSISPQDSINEDIIAQLGSFNIDEYIGDPRNASLSTYPKLDELRNFYFQKYLKSQNLFDIIKLLSYFDNSLFKMIKDFVPAKSNLSTGLIIKPHILERNKQPKYEPILEFNEYEGEIDTAFISGSNGLNREYNTDNTIKTSYISGSIFTLNTDRRELINGELGGTILTVHSQSLENIKYELNNLPISSSQDIINNFSRLPINPTLNNINNSTLNNTKLKLNYSTNLNIPVNNTFIKNIYINGSNINNFPFLYSETQLSNYTLTRHTQPRYEGSKLIGTKYNEFTPGDISLGKDPVINNNTTKFVYFNEISQPLSPVSGNIGGIPTVTFPGRVNANIKYLIDSSSNVIELTQANKNLFDIQSIYNNTLANVSLFDVNKPSNQKLLDGLKPIYAGGYRYEPILQNYQKSSFGNLFNPKFLTFELENPIQIENPETQVTSSLNLGNIIVNPPQLVSNINFNISPSPTISAILNSALRFNVQRDISGFTGEIRQRVQGQVTVTLRVGGSNEPVQVWTGTNFSGTTRLAPLVGVHFGQSTYGFWIDGFNFNDRLGSIKVPQGKRVIMNGLGGADGNFGNFFKTYNSGFHSGGTSNSFCPLCIRAGGFRAYAGYDGMLIILNNTSLTIPLQSTSNSFGGTTTISYKDPSGQSISPENGVYNIDTELLVNITFTYDGLIVLPQDENNLQVDLKTLSNTPGTLGFNLAFTRTPQSPNIRFISNPNTNINYSSINSQTPYFLTGAPSTIYLNNINVSASLGDGDVDFWYFERGNSIESGSRFTYLTASYDLSKMYYDYIIQNNNLLQILPTASINHPIEPLQRNEEYFIPKKSDLIRFFNHGSETFPTDPQFEREIINIYPPLLPAIGSGSNGTGSYENRLVFEVNGDNIPNSACINDNEITGSVIGKIKNFIFLSKVPDETNIVLISNKKQGVSSDGIVLADDVNNELKEEAGNIVKQLKSQNLI